MATSECGVCGHYRSCSACTGAVVRLVADESNTHVRMRLQEQREAVAARAAQKAQEAAKAAQFRKLQATYELALKLACAERRRLTLTSVPHGRLIARLTRLHTNDIDGLAVALGWPAAAGAWIDDIAATCCTNGFAHKLTDTFLAEREPLPAWAVDRVLLSPDLLAQIMRRLELEDSGAAAVCRVWHNEWATTAQHRRRLSPAHLPEPDFDLPTLCLASTPGGERLFFACRSGDWPSPERIVAVDDQMRTVHERSLGEDQSCISMAASSDSLFLVTASFDGLELQRIELNGFTVAARILLQVSHLAVSPHGLLFGSSALTTGIFYIDAQSLAPSPEFGANAIDTMVTAMAVVDGGLYVADVRRGALQIFSLGGQHLHEIQGGWCMPRALTFAAGRLYLAESLSEEQTAAEGRRIFVLTPEGNQP